MLGSLSNYRRWLKDSVFAHHDRLPWYGHGIAGIGAGWTVSFVAAPVEHVKARLQVQYHDVRRGKEGARFKGPVDCVRKIVGCMARFSWECG